MDAGAHAGRGVTTHASVSPASTAQASSTQRRRRSSWFGLADVSRDLSIDGLLERIVAEACRVGGATRGILDVVDSSADQRFARFVSHGVAGHSASEGDPGREALVHLVEHATSPVGTLAYLGIRIHVDGRPFANLYLFDQVEGAGFAAEDEDVLGAFASSAGLMISTALVQHKSSRDRRWLDASAEIATTLLGPVSPASARQVVVDQARDVASATCAILLQPDGDGELVITAVSGIDPDPLVGEAVPILGTLVGRPARTGRAVVVPHTELDRRYDPSVTPHWPALRTVQMLPMRDRVHPDEVAHTGTLVVGWAGSRALDAWELDPELPERFAEQAAQVLHLAREAGDSRRIAVAEDRGRISRDLHDIVIQRLFAIGMTLDQTARTSQDPQTVDSVTAAVDGIDETIADLRRTIAGLERDDADGVDLTALLSRMAADAGELMGVQPEVTFSGPIATHLSGTIREHVIAVAGEMLSNIVQHSGAEHVSMDVSVDHDVVLTVTDDGHGMELGDDRQGGNGMRNMKRRAELLGGRCEAVSSTGHGTTMTWRVPSGTDQPGTAHT